MFLNDAQYAVNYIDDTILICFELPKTHLDKIYFIIGSPSNFTKYELTRSSMSDSKDIYTANIKYPNDNFNFSFLIYNKEGIYVFDHDNISFIYKEDDLEKIIKEESHFDTFISEFDNLVHYHINDEISFNAEFLNKLGIKYCVSYPTNDNYTNLISTIISFFNNNSSASDIKKEMVLNLINPGMNSLYKKFDKSIKINLNNLESNLKMAYLMLFSMPYQVEIFGGDELGNSKDDLDMFYFFQTLVSYKKTSPAFNSYDIEFLVVDNNLLIYRKMNTYFIYNSGKTPLRITLPLCMQNKTMYSIFCNNEKELKDTFIIGGKRFFCLEEL